MQNWKFIKPTITQLFIDGKFVNSLSGKTFDTINPATEEIITQIQLGDKEDIDMAVKAARLAFDKGPWRSMSAYDRAGLINKLADLIEQNYDELAALESLDTGKSFQTSKNVDINVVLGAFRYMAGWTDKLNGQVLPSRGNFFQYTKQEPVGVVGMIVPWNYPLFQTAWKVAPALAAGCTMVIKPSEFTPLSVLKFSELVQKAGFPNGVVNVVPGYGPSAGQALVEHPLIDKISFTGSSRVGQMITSVSGANNLKRVTLELGGKSANIILDDADIEKAAEQAIAGMSFPNAGQNCVSGSRVFIQEQIHDKVVEAIVKKVSQFKLGEWWQENIDQGPQINKLQQTKILEYIELGKQQGAKCVLGGQRHGNKGFFVQPTIFINVTDDMKIAQDEIFGPVMSILKFQTIDEVIERANNSHYGLGAGICSNNFNYINKIANELRVGQVYVNCYDCGDINTPFGGFKNSGYGREGGKEAINAYLETKTVIMHTSNQQ